MKCKFCNSEMRERTVTCSSFYILSLSETFRLFECDICHSRYTNEKWGNPTWTDLEQATWELNEEFPGLK